MIVIKMNVTVAKGTKVKLDKFLIFRFAKISNKFLHKLTR